MKDKWPDLFDRVLRTVDLGRVERRCMAPGRRCYVEGEMLWVVELAKRETRIVETVDVQTQRLCGWVVGWIGDQVCHWAWMRFARDCTCNDSFYADRKQ